MTKKIIVMLVIMVNLLACVGITHPGKTYIFQNQNDIFYFDQNAPLRKRMPNENFGKEAFYLEVHPPAINDFDYSLVPSFFLDGEYQQVVIHEVSMLYKEKEYILSKNVETFKLRRWWRSTLRSYRLPLDSYYYGVDYMDEEQDKRMNRGNDNYLSIVPIVDFTKIFKEKIGISFPVSITVTYQIDGGETIMHTSHYDVEVRKNKYISYFEGY